MSNKDALKVKLKDALKLYGADLGFVITDTQMQKLLDAGMYKTIGTKGCDGQRLASAIMRAGKVLQQSDDEKTYIAEIGSGIGGMNIAMAAIELDGDEVKVLAIAREGLIKQHTTKRAIEKIEKALG